LKGFLKKYGKYILALFIVFVIIIPMGINFLFKLESPVSFFAAEWSAGEVLNFYGSLVASGATIIGVYLSIDYAQRNYREDEKNRIRPYLALTHIRSRSNYNFVIGKNNENEPVQHAQDTYKEFRLERVYIILSKDGIAFKDGLDDRQRQLLVQYGLRWEAMESGYRLMYKDFVSLPFEVENVGMGPALDLKIAFYKITSSEHKGASVYTLKPNDKIYFHIFSELEDDALLGQYVIDLRYQDIQGTQFTQKYPTYFERKEELNNRVSQIVDFTGKQEILLEEIQDG
jgi:hypothetical protein